VENRYVVYICVCVYIYNGAAIWVAFNCNSYQMHLNIDLDMDTQDDFKYAVSVLQDNLQDYDICRSKLVTRHISSPKKNVATTFLFMSYCLMVICQLQIWIPTIYREHWVMLCVNLVHSRIDIFDLNHWTKQEVIELHSTLKKMIPLIHDALCLATEWRKNKMPNISWFKSPFQACTR
jgi:hypothetical protein